MRGGRRRNRTYLRHLPKQEQLPRAVASQAIVRAGCQLSRSRRADMNAEGNAMLIHRLAVVALGLLVLAACSDPGVAPEAETARSQPSAPAPAAGVTAPAEPSPALAAVAVAVEPVVPRVVTRERLLAVRREGLALAAANADAEPILRVSPGEIIGIASEVDGWFQVEVPGYLEIEAWVQESLVTVEWMEPPEDLALAREERRVELESLSLAAAQRDAVRAREAAEAASRRGGSGALLPAGRRTSSGQREGRPDAGQAGAVRASIAKLEAQAKKLEEEAGRIRRAASGDAKQTMLMKAKSQQLSDQASELREQAAAARTSVR